MNTRRLDARAYVSVHIACGLAIAVLALWAFGALIDEVLERAWLERWDLATAARIHAQATALGTRIAVAVSDIGSPATMFVIATIAIVVLWRRARVDALTWLGAVGGGGILDQVLKHAVHRARPAAATRYLHIDSFSFPSGHAMLATIGFGMIAFALRRAPHARRIVAYVAAVLGTLLVAASRLYLGVHFPSDVLGGVLAGAGWLAVCVTGAMFAYDRRQAR